MAEEGQGTSGWVIFASIMLVGGSLSHFATGMTFLLNTDWVLETTSYTSESDVHLIGWISLGIGALMVISAWGVLSARTWARVVGIIFGILTVIHGFTNLQVNLFWGLLGILVGAGIVYALLAKGMIVAPDQEGVEAAGGRPTLPQTPPDLWEAEERPTEGP
jgi:hypothetical protein